jgi:uncharacterized small protein (DUF1192 family)
MFDEEDRPKPKAALLPRKLEGLSREDLREYLDFLAEEKNRTEHALHAKSGMEAAAAALFKSK